MKISLTILVTILLISVESNGTVVSDTLRNDGYYVLKSIDNAGESYWRILFFQSNGVMLDTIGHGQVPVFTKMPVINSNKKGYTVTQNGNDLDIKLSINMPLYHVGEGVTEMKCRMINGVLEIIEIKYTKGLGGTNKQTHKWIKSKNEVYSFVPF